MESSIFRDLDGIVDSILSPYHTLEEVLPSGCDAGPVWMDFDCWVDSQKVDMRTSESPLLLNICGIPASGKSYWAENGYQRMDLVCISLSTLLWGHYPGIKRIAR